MEKVSASVAFLFRSFSDSLSQPTAVEPPPEAVPDATVSSIFIYPIKSCRGISVPHAYITPTGFAWDRQWVIINSNGRAYTQRIEPKLALLSVELPNDAFADNWMSTDESFLLLRAPGMDTLKIPLNNKRELVPAVSVWEWSGSAYDEGHEASTWLTEYIGKPSHLVCFNSGSEIRAVDPAYAPGYKTTFSDGFPFMLISQGSLNSLNMLLKEPLLINRFRPNILVDGCKPFDEDLWKLLKINRLVFHGVKLCSRCKVPTVNQETGKVGVEPTETLRKFRSDKVLRHTDKHGKVYFGQNLVCEESHSMEKGKIVRVGDPVYVLQKFSSFIDAPV